RPVDGLTAAMARRAGALDGEEALAGAHLALAAAGWAGLRPRAGLGAGATARIADHLGRDPDGRRLAGKGFVEGDLHVVAQVGAARGRARAAASRELAEHLVEDVGEAAREIEATRAAGAVGAVLERGVAKAVISRAPLVVLENVVGFV